jgi:hypothetical protein
MVDFFVRKTAMFVIALGLLLNGVFPCCAWAGMDGKPTIPVGMSMTMPGMSMQQIDLHSVAKGAPAKGMPGNSMGGCFAFCSCAIPVLAVQDSLSAQMFHYGDGWFARDVDRDSLATLPSLPPPIA